MGKPKKKLTPYNRHVQKQMKAGKSMKQAAASWSKKDKKPKASAAKASKSTRSKSKSKSTGGRSTVAKNGFSTQKLFKYVRLGALALPAATVILDPSHSPQYKMKELGKQYLGINHNGTFNWGNLAKGWLPFLASIVITTGIPKIAKMIRSF